MRSKKTQIAIFSTLVLISLQTVLLTHAQEAPPQPSPEGEGVTETTNTPVPDVLPEETVTPPPTPTAPLGETVNREKTAKNRLLTKLLKKFTAGKIDIRDLNRKISNTKEKYTEAKEGIGTLAALIKEIDRNIRKQERKIDDFKLQINDVQDDIHAAGEAIHQKEDELASQETVIQDYMKAMFMQSQNNTLELLLSSDTLGGAMEEAESVSRIESSGQALFEKLNVIKTDLEAKKTHLAEQNDRLQALKKRAERERSSLTDERTHRADLMEQTKGQQAIYENFIAESVAEQAQIDEELSQMREHIVELDTSGRLQYIEAQFLAFGNKFGEISAHGLAWPVDPARGITAFFHDPSYRASMGMEHQAIDIRADQGTPIMAPADGYVFKVRDNGFGYSFIVLLHSMTLSTVYGHVSEFAVKEGEMVRQGEVIGYTGGRPGSKGAGLMTTGPHLHFETRENGIPVDPLSYLP